MESGKQIKEIVKEKYGAIAEQSRQQNASSCCGSTCGCSNVEFTVMSEDYSKLAGYEPEADLALGCGLPTEYAMIKPGDTVIDLGSGAGNDCFVARSIVGTEGRVIGIDMTEPMIEKARGNAKRLGMTNVEFRLGDIENIPVEDNSADVVVSNCVMNLVPDKKRAFAETFRIIKPGGHFSISDIVLHGELPDGVRRDASLYAGCIAGAIQREEYLRTVAEAGFTNIQVQKARTIEVPDEIYLRHVSPEDLAEVKRNGLGILSVTVYADKPLAFLPPHG